FLTILFTMPYCTISEVKAKLPRAFIVSGVPNNISDSDLLEWIQNRAAVIFAKLLNRGIDAGSGVSTTPWAANHAQALGDMILDSNGNIQQYASASGTTGSTQPVWNIAVGGSTADNAKAWTK